MSLPPTLKEISIQVGLGLCRKSRINDMARKFAKFMLLKKTPMPHEFSIAKNILLLLLLGLSWFILYGSNPAAWSLRASCLLKVTKSLIPRSSPMRLTLTTSSLTAAGVYFLSPENSRRPWAVAACCMGGLLPYSLYLMRPINLKVMADEVAEENAHDVINKWWQFHLLRTLISSGCFVYVTYKLIKQKTE